MLKLNTEEFINRIIKRGFKQFHLDEMFTFSILKNKKIPAKVKNAIKDSGATTFFDGGLDEKTKFIFIKLKDGKQITPESAKMKFINFIKTCILIDKNDPNIIDSNVAVFYLDKNLKITEAEEGGKENPDVGVIPADTTSDKKTEEIKDTEEISEETPEETETSNDNKDEEPVVQSDKVLFLGVGLKFN